MDLCYACLIRIKINKYIYLYNNDNHSACINDSS